MEAQVKIKAVVYKSLKSKNDDEAKKFLKQNVRLMAKKIIDKMPDDQFNNIFDTEINAVEGEIIINVRLKQNG